MAIAFRTSPRTTALQASIAPPAASRALSYVALLKYIESSLSESCLSSVDGRSEKCQVTLVSNEYGQRTL